MNITKILSLSLFLISHSLWSEKVEVAGYSCPLHQIGFHQNQLQKSQSTV